VDCSDNIILSTKFVITKPPTLLHISPSSRTVRVIPPHVAMPEVLVKYYGSKEWMHIAAWDSMWNPLGEGFAPKAVECFGVALKAYTKAVDRIPYVSLRNYSNELSRWLGLIIIGALSSVVLYNNELLFSDCRKWLHGT
jgi:hypothetical protein